MVALEIRSLEKRFGKTHVLRGVSLVVERGQIFGLLGANGAGKTTTLDCALGLLRPDSGTISILGETATHIHRTCGRVAALFDRHGLIPGLTVHQNLRYARRLLGHDGGRGIEEALDRVELTPLADARAGALSVGEQKRAALARALVGRPELLVLDEPLSGLDPLGVRSMLALFQDLARDGITLVLSSHRLEEMERVVTHAGVLAGGRLLRSGPIEELLEAPTRSSRLTASPPERARAVLARLRGVIVHDERGVPVTDAGTEWREFEVVTDGVSTHAINRALVEGGCEVAAIGSAPAGLRALFENLVDTARDKDTDA